MAGALEKLLARVVSFLEKEKVDYMVLGGFALPSYGAIRSTLDLDVAVRIRNSAEFDSFAEAAAEAGFVPSVHSFSEPMSVFRDSETGLEVEFWLRPDGIEWDAETLRRRRKTAIGHSRVQLVSPEDFIVTKLSRPDRGVQDEKDVKSVLVRLGGSIDRRYLKRRAAKAGVLALLSSIEEAS